ncbi:MAG: tetratricopeptide repeat protein [Gammaproteobacteria bacterium]|nr:tetratricopeptide repeat protein [Gammaproteobacteria bacterium]
MKYAGMGILLSFCFVLTACVSGGDRETLASLRDRSIEIKEEKIEGSLEKALESYQKFLEETPESAMTPEAIRRLADLKIEKEYSAFSGDKPAENTAKQDSSKPESSQAVSGKPVTTHSKEDAIAKVGESMKDFEKRATQKTEFKSVDKTAELPAGSADDLQTAGAMEAIQLYKNLLVKYPLYERNDQVLYQLSRAYEETGQVEEAMKVLNRLVKEYPKSRHIDEAQFRRAEFFFTRKRYLDSEEAYQAVLDIGIGSAFYELALYKQGWAFFKQELYEQALDDFIGLLDYKLSIGYDFEQTNDKIEQKRIEDTYRVISLGFSYLGGAKSVVEYFDKKGQRIYEASIYSHLAEYYLDKRRYADSADTYNTYVERNPMNKVSPYFHIRVIEIYLKGGFPKLVIESKKTFSINYGLRGAYWSFFDINAFPDVLSYLKLNLVDLANHYHAMYQDRRLRQYKADNFKEATHWYREYLVSFPEEAKAAGMNFQLAELLLQNKDYRGAALEYERTAYDYSSHEKSSAAGYAAVFAYREFLKSATQSERVLVKREVIRSSLRFADAFPRHENAVLVLVAATDDLYEMKDYELAIKTGRKVIKTYPKSKPEYLRSAWLVVAHASFDITSYKDAEDAYVKVLSMTPKQQKAYADLSENLAASIYKQGEQARLLEDFKTAAEHFLRVAIVTPNSRIRATAEFDGAAALIALKDWPRAAQVLVNFRKRYPQHEYQQDVTKKLAIVYKEDGKLMLAAAEFERIERESRDNDIRREALLQAAELYEKAENEDRALAVYNRFVKYFPTPIEFVLDTRQKIADIYLKRKQHKLYIAQLKTIIQADARAGKERTDRTRYLAAKASLVMVEPLMDEYTKVKLVRPFKRNLKKKKQRMKTAIDAFTRLVDYEVGEVTAAATYYIAEIYMQFSKALMTSERPKKLNELELEQYELVIEEQAFPFEEKSITVHEKNMELLDLGIYNEWIDKSIEKLAAISPARYAKPEVKSEFVRSMVPDLNPVKPEPVKQSPKENKSEKVDAAVMIEAGT